MDDLKLIPAKTATEAAPHFAPSEDNVPAPGTEESPLAYLMGLAEAGHLPDATSFLAAALPRREGVWWACRCIRSILGATGSTKTEAALAAAEAWTASPGDLNRRKAMAAAEAVGFVDPAGCAALAVFLSGGSIVPPQLKEVPPPSGSCARALAGAVQLAAVRVEPPRIAATYRGFLDLGLAVARGEDRWKSSL